MKMMIYIYKNISHKKPSQLPFLLVVLTLSVFNSIVAQKVLKLEEAITIAVHQNYQVQLGLNGVEISKRSTQLSGVATKPTLGLSSGINGNLADSKFKSFKSPDAITNTSVPSMDANVGVAASMLLWDGKRTKYQVNQKREEEVYSLLNLNSTKEELAWAVANNYYNIARMIENRALLQSSFDISKKRKLRSSYAFEFGTQDRLGMLNASVDMNRDSIELVKFDQQIINAKRKLNLLLNRKPSLEFDVETAPTIERNLSYNKYYDQAMANNIELQLAKQNLNISNFDSEINSAALKPSVRANASYGANYQKNSNIEPNPNPVPIDYSVNGALRLGLTASWNIIDGGRTKYLNEIAALNIKSDNLKVELIKNQIDVDLSNAWGDYQNALLILDLEAENVKTTEENFIRTEERFKNGQVNSITFRQAQINLLLSQLNYSGAKYNAKLIEIEMNKLSGQIF